MIPPGRRETPWEGDDGFLNLWRKSQEAVQPILEREAAAENFHDDGWAEVRKLKAAVRQVINMHDMSASEYCGVYPSERGKLTGFGPACDLLRGVLASTPDKEWRG